jgi:hypothetical protein
MRRLVVIGVLGVVGGCSDDGLSGASSDTEAGSTTGPGSTSPATTDPSSSSTQGPSSGSTASGTTDATTDEATTDASSGGESTGPVLQELAVVVGYGARRVSSLDGDSWENFVEVDSNGGDDVNLLRGVGHGGGAFVAVGGASTGLSFSTVDGAQWDNENRTMRAFLSDVVWFEDQFVAVGGNGLRVRTTDLGASWEDDAGFESGHFRGVAASADLVVAVGNTYGGAGLWSTTADAMDWTEVGTGGPELRDVAHGNDVFVAVGLEGRIASSPDGETWEDHSQPSGSFVRVAFVDGVFYVADGDRYWTSADGAQWSDTEVTTAHPIAGVFAGRFFAVGLDGSIFAAEDLDDWETVFSMDGGAFTAMATGLVEMP